MRRIVVRTAFTREVTDSWASVGIIAALLGFLGRNLLGKGDVRSVAALLAVVALGFLLIALGVVVAGVLIPSAGRTIATHEFERYSTYEFISQERVMIQGRRLSGATELLSRERQRNRWKARFLLVGYVAMACGILCAAVSAAILALQGHFYD
jgi:hypothetical protein